MKSTGRHPNIIIMYADDLGFGDVGCYGARGIPTPNVDRLAVEGLKFLQGYATAATCTPSRYSLLTGSYPWRNEQACILTGDAPLIIPRSVQTLPSLLKQAGYRTGIVGKWHLGLGKGDLNWNGSVSATPLDVGFDQSFIMPATNDRVPCVYLAGRNVAGLDAADPIEVSYAPENPFPGIPTGRSNPELLRMRHSHGHDMSIINGVGRIGYMRGGNSALWKDEEMAEVFLGQALSFIRENREQPFFLYYAFHQPHVPRMPGRRFAGSTQHGPRGDAIVEMDWCVGEVVRELDRLSLREDTIVIFSSDNGPVLDDGYEDGAAALRGDHRPAGPLRGGKYSMFDGGCRVPFILRWTGTVAPGETSAVVSHVDFAASFAALAGVPLDSASAPDSLDMVPALLGRRQTGRHELVTEGMQTGTVLRRGDWAYIPRRDGPAVDKWTGIELGNSNEAQLYDLSRDIGQIRNAAGERGDIVKAMTERLSAIRNGGRTRAIQRPEH